MTLQFLINAVGLVLNIIGVIVVYINSPINQHIIGGGFIEDKTDYGRITKTRNTLMKVGVMIILLGSFLQLAANIYGEFFSQ